MAIDTTVIDAKACLEKVKQFVLRESDRIVFYPRNADEFEVPPNGFVGIVTKILEEYHIALFRKALQPYLDSYTDKFTHVVKTWAETGMVTPDADGVRPSRRVVFLSPNGVSTHQRLLCFPASSLGIDLPKGFQLPYEPSFSKQPRRFIFNSTKLH